MKRLTIQELAAMVPTPRVDRMRVGRAFIARLEEINPPLPIYNDTVGLMFDRAQAYATATVTTLDGDIYHVTARREGDPA